MKTILAILFAALVAAGCATRPPVVMRTIPDCLDNNRFATFRVDADLTKSDSAEMPDWLKVGPPQRASGHGSGSVIHESGYILTNAHVVTEKGWKCKQSISAYLRGHRKPMRLNCAVIAIDTKLDLAVLKIDQKFDHVVTIAEPGELEDGESVYNIGYPFDFGEMIGRGYVNRQDFSPEGNTEPEYDGTILMDIPDGPGTSGSGIFLERSGRLVGVMMAYTYRRTDPDSPPMVVRVAIPVERIRKFLDDNGIPYHTGRPGQRACTE